MTDTPTPELPFPLSHLPPEHGWQPHPQVACHVATSDDNRFLLAATLHEDGTLLYHECSADLMLYFMQECKGGELLMHDADRAMTHIIPHLEQMAAANFDTQVCVNGQEHIIYAVIRPSDKTKRGTWRLRDTQAVLPMPLAELGPISGIAPQEPGGDMREYLAETCKLILAAYRGYCKVIRRQWQIGPARTAGSTALKTFRRRLNPYAAHYRQRAEVESMARDAYVGGLTWYADTNLHTNYAKIDVNAMYATVMRDVGVPTGVAAGTCFRDELNRPAIYTVNFKCPKDNPFPFVPVRTEKGVRYPKRGTHETVITSLTMEAAEARGYTFEVISGFVWQQVEHIFSEWVNECEMVELGSQGAGYKKVVKEMRNSLSGKFGQKPIGKSYVITNNPTEEMTPAVGFDGLEIDYLWYYETAHEQPHIQPHWAAWITSAARNVLVEAIYRIGPEVCAYGDTDSIVAPYERLVAAGLPTGTRYGEWKIVCEYKSFLALHGKTYIGQYYSGAWEMKHNGVPQGCVPNAEIAGLLSGEALRVLFPSTPHALDTLGGKSISPVTIARTISSVYNKDRWDNGPNGPP